MHFSVNFCFLEATERVVIKSQLNFRAGKVELLLNGKYIKILFGNEDELKKYIYEITAMTEDEIFLLELHNKHLKYPEDERGDRTGIRFEEVRILNV